MFWFRAFVFIRAWHFLNGCYVYKCVNSFLPWIKTKWLPSTFSASIIFALNQNKIITVKIKRVNSYLLWTKTKSFINIQRVKPYLLWIKTKSFIKIKRLCEPFGHFDLNLDCIHNCLWVYEIYINCTCFSPLSGWLNHSMDGSFERAKSPNTQFSLLLKIVTFLDSGSYKNLVCFTICHKIV